MQVHLNTSIMRLEETPLDVGYASQSVTLTNESGQACSIAGQKEHAQLILSTPFIDDALLHELKEIIEINTKESEHLSHVTLIVANDSHKNPKIEGLDFLIDSSGEFGDWYGLRLVGQPLEGELTKALMLISKDGAIFHDDYPQDLDQAFNHERLYRKMLAAHTCYTGKGCH